MSLAARSASRCGQLSRQVCIEESMQERQRSVIVANVTNQSGVLSN